MKKTIALLAGDGIGPEVTRAAVTVLREAAHEFHHQFDFADFPIGGAAIDAAGAPLPNATLDACRKADAVFLGAVGGPKWDSLPVGERTVGVAPGPGALRKCAPSEAVGALARNFAVKGRPAWRPGPGNRARACRRHVFRSARKRRRKWCGTRVRHGIVL